MTKKKKVRGQRSLVAYEDRAHRELAHMKHKDLQKACIMRGMASQDMVNANHHTLVSYFIKNYDRGEDINLLPLHDAWVEEQMVKRGYQKGKEFLHPALKFGISGDIDKVEKVKEVKPDAAVKVPNPKNKERAQMDEVTKVRKGTKKDLTYTLTREGKPQAEIIAKVMEVFPEAQEKSIKIWHKRAVKQMQAEKK